MSIKNFSFKQIKEKADYIRKILLSKDLYWGSNLRNDYRTFMENNEYAPLIGTICDERINADDAWNFPYWLHKKMKKEAQEFKLESLLNQNFEKELREYLKDKWPKGMSEKDREDYLRRIPRYLESALKFFIRINCSPVDLFENRAYCALEVYFTLRRIPGIGPKKANMITRDFIYISKGKKDPNGWFIQIKRKNPRFKVERENLLDMPIDVHVIKVFNRIFGRFKGNWRRELPNHILDVIAFSKLVSPEFPAKLDGLFWRVGREYCHDRNPKCTDCCLNKICEIGIKTISQ